MLPVFWFFIFFIASGFCSLVYQIVWLRVAMADFGVTTPTISIVLSIFMAGLALGSWGGGRLADRLQHTSAPLFLRFYALAEAIIGLSGIVVAPMLMQGRVLLAGLSEASWNSTAYYGASGIWIALVLLPFCTCMGATFPLCMAAVRSTCNEYAETSFSYLYVANVLGALLGTMLSAFVLIELLGLRGTMLAAAIINVLVTLLAFWLSFRIPAGSTFRKPDQTAVTVAEPRHDSRMLVLLFVTGLVSLAMEVIWTRLFVSHYGPFVYTFAVILMVYLVFTLIGSRFYRIWIRHHPLLDSDQSWRILAILAGLTSLFPLLAADYRAPLGTLRMVIGIGPFCAILGFLTPRILDRVSGGDPRRAGFAYALNTIGCIIGPIVAGFLLLPLCGERWSLIFLALPLFVLGFLPNRREAAELTMSSKARMYAFGMVTIVIAIILVIGTRDFEQRFPQSIVMRDHTATVIATGAGMKKSLYVNGVGITLLTPITKMMVHLPLAFLEHPPEQGLVLCLGMGTSYRSMLTWGISSTVVELVPSVQELLPFYQVDGKQMQRAANGTIVVDDARRFLERSLRLFDVIVVDPPPPIEASASSLLYSREFYASVDRHLTQGGIFQQWIPNGEPVVQAAIVKALTSQFPYVRAFTSVEGWGVHLLASRQPIASKSPTELAARLPEKVAADIVEWGPYATPKEQFECVLAQEKSLHDITDPFPRVAALSDDKPLNEYYLMRKLFKFASN
ncbi:MAG: hypothetical protein CXR31_06100 [Geobacter sp.]|nr:MAG: hypothetical protein CXR31_06100 [Geobacter sp.]